MGQGPSFHYVLHKGVPIRASSCYSSTNKVAVNKGKYSDLNASYSLERITVNEMWFVREKRASSEERHVLCCWGWLEGRSETNPPVTAVCQLQHPVGRQRLCFQALVEEAPGNLPQVVYPLSQGGSDQLGEARSCDPPRPSVTPWSCSPCPCVGSGSILCSAGDTRVRTGALVSAKIVENSPSKQGSQCNPLVQADRHSHLFVKDPF